MNDEKSSTNKEISETKPNPEKGPLSFISGSLTSFLLCIFFYFSLFVIRHLANC